MALFACKVGGVEGGLDVKNANLTVTNTQSGQYSGSATATIQSGHVAVVGIGQQAQLNSNPIVANITITGTEGTDYEVVLNDASSKVLNGQVSSASLQNLKVIKAINPVTITVTHNGGTNYASCYGMILDLS